MSDPLCFVSQSENESKRSVLVIYSERFLTKTAVNVENHEIAWSTLRLVK